MKIRTIVLAGAAALVALVTTGGVAFASHGADDIRPPAAPAPAVSLPVAAAPAPLPVAPAAPQVSAPVSRTDAERIALAAVGGSRLTHVTELESEHGRTVWTVRVATSSGERRVDVDTVTGAVNRIR